MKGKLITVTYPKRILVFENESLENVTSQIFEEESDPDTVTVDSIMLRWDPSLFHYCYAHNRISEEDLIRMTLIENALVNNPN